jgi:hypothetical protein
MTCLVVKQKRTFFAPPPSSDGGVSGDAGTKGSAVWQTRPPTQVVRHTHKDILTFPPEKGLCSALAAIRAGWYPGYFEFWEAAHITDIGDRLLV